MATIKREKKEYMTETAVVGIFVRSSNSSSYYLLTIPRVIILHSPFLFSTLSSSFSESSTSFSARISSSS